MIKVIETFFTGDSTVCDWRNTVSLWCDGTVLPETVTWPLAIYFRAEWGAVGCHASGTVVMFPSGDVDLRDPSTWDRIPGLVEIAEWLADGGFTVVVDGDPKTRKRVATRAVVKLMDGMDIRLLAEDGREAYVGPFDYADFMDDLPYPVRMRLLREGRLLFGDESDPERKVRAVIERWTK